MIDPFPHRHHDHPEDNMTALIILACIITGSIIGAAVVRCLRSLGVV
jgi:hypothetical protein